MELLEWDENKSPFNMLCLQVIRGKPVVEGETPPEVSVGIKQ